MDQNIKLVPSFYHHESRHSLSENQKMQISLKVFFHFPSLQFLPLLNLHSHLCDAQSVWHPREKKKKKRFWKRDMKESKPLLETVRSFNSPRGVIQRLHKLGHSTLLIGSCFCLPNSPSTLSMTIGNQQTSNVIFNITHAYMIYIQKWCFLPG